MCVPCLRLAMLALLFVLPLLLPCNTQVVLSRLVLLLTTPFSLLLLLHHERTSHTTQFAVWSGNCRLGGQNQFLVDGKPSRTRRITPHRRRQRLEHGCRPSEQHASVWRREWFDLCIDQQWCGETIETKRTKAQWRSLWHGHVRLD